MKVSAVCPSCGRPTASKGRGECLYCGATLEAVPTGAMTAAGSGQAVPKPPPTAPTPAATGVPPAPRPTASRKVAVPLLYQERAAKMQAEAPNPVAEFFSSGTGKVLIWLGGIVLVAGSIIGFMTRVTRTDINLTNVSPNAAPTAAAPGLPQAEAQAREAAKRVDARSAIRTIGDAIEANAQRDGHYPDFVARDLTGLQPGRDFAAELNFFAGGKILSYRVSIDSVSNRETFFLEAVSKATGETLTESRSRTSYSDSQLGSDPIYTPPRDAYPPSSPP